MKCSTAGGTVKPGQSDWSVGWMVAHWTDAIWLWCPDFFLSYLNFTCLRWPLTFWEFRLASTFDSFLNDWQFWNQLILQRLFYLVWLRVTKTHKEHRLMHATWKYNLPWVPLQNSVLNIHNLCLQLLLTFLLILSPFSERHHWNDLCQAQ